MNTRSANPQVGTSSLPILKKAPRSMASKINNPSHCVWFPFTLSGHHDPHVLAEKIIVNDWESDIPRGKFLVIVKKDYSYIGLKPKNLTLYFNDPEVNFINLYGDNVSIRASQILEVYEIRGWMMDNRDPE